MLRGAFIAVARRVVLLLRHHAGTFIHVGAFVLLDHGLGPAEEPVRPSDAHIGAVWCRKSERLRNCRQDSVRS